MNLQIYFQEISHSTPELKLQSTSYSPIIDPHQSPDGSMLAYVRDNELHVLKFSCGEPKQLTFGIKGNGKVRFSIPTFYKVLIYFSFSKSLLSWFLWILKIEFWFFLILRRDFIKRKKQRRNVKLWNMGPRFQHRLILKSKLNSLVCKHYGSPPYQHVNSLSMFWLWLSSMGNRTYHCLYICN